MTSKTPIEFVKPGDFVARWKECGLPVPKGMTQESLDAQMRQVLADVLLANTGATMQGTETLFLAPAPTLTDEDLQRCHERAVDSGKSDAELRQQLAEGKPVHLPMFVERKP
jgi:hypothetical protein